MMKKPVDAIRQYLDQDELLCQLAEESDELGHAALKLRRAGDGTNPTPVTPEEAFENLLEEIGDVSNCLVALGYDQGLILMRIKLKAQEKMARWAERLEEKHADTQA